MTYKEFIDNILKTRGRFACGNEYYERHHIIPRCMGGGNDSDNLIDLFAREHYKAHRLLALENPEHNGLQYAWFNMCNIKGNNMQRRYMVSAREYEDARIAISRHPTMLGKHLSAEARAKLSIYQKQRWQDHEYRKKMIEYGKKLIGANNPNYGNHKLAGKNNPNYGKHLSKECRQKISIARKGKYANGDHPRSIAVVQCDINLTPIRVYSCSMEVSKKTNIDNSTIGKVCKGERKTVGGYRWKFLYDYTRKDGTIIPGAISLGLITEEEALRQLNNP